MAKHATVDRPELPRSHLESVSDWLFAIIDACLRSETARDIVLEAKSQGPPQSVTLDRAKAWYGLRPIIHNVMLFMTIGVPPYPVASGKKYKWSTERSVWPEAIARLERLGKLTPRDDGDLIHFGSCEEPKMRPCVRVAYNQFRAAERDGHGKTDEMAYRYTEERLQDSDEELPKLETWKRYVGEGRRHARSWKNKPPSFARASTRSIRRQD